MPSVDANGDFVIDEEELCEYIAKKLTIDSDTVSTVLDAELDFLDSKGLVLEDKPSEQGNLKDVPVAEIDSDELKAYVVSRTGLNPETVELILDTEMRYLEEQGVTG